MTTSDVWDSQQSHDLRRAAEQGTIRRAEHHGSSPMHIPAHPAPRTSFPASTPATM